MPISGLDPAALAALRPAELADLALASDQERRRLSRLGRYDEAMQADRECRKLAALYRDR